MPLYTSDEVNLFLNIQGLALPGLLGGSPQFPRATLVRGGLRVYHFQFEQATPNPMPGVAPAALASNDSIIIALMKPTDRVYAGIWTSNAWGGTNTFIGFGRIDPNNANNTDLTYFEDPVTVVTANDWFTTPGFFNKNLCTQVGDDPQGDQSVGNQIPEFGSQDIQIVATIASDALGTGGTIEGYLLITEEGST